MWMAAHGYRKPFSASILDRQSPMPARRAEGVLFRVVLGAESVATTLDRKALEGAMGESWLARFLKFGKPSRSFNCYARTAKAKRAA